MALALRQTLSLRQYWTVCMMEKLKTTKNTFSDMGPQGARALTTVSTYISEVHKMKTRHAMYSYIFMTFMATQTFLFIINGLF